MKLSSKYEKNEPYLNVFTEGVKLPLLKKVIREIRHGLNQGLKPHPGEGGLSGNYFMRNQHKKYVAIFKPVDEEAYAPNNPKGFPAPFGTPGFRKGILSGECAAREVASYMLDPKGLHKVPETAFVEVKHDSFFSRMKGTYETGRKDLMPFSDQDISKGVKFGSLQILKDNQGESGDFGYSMFSVE